MLIPTIALSLTLALAPPQESSFARITRASMVLGSGLGDALTTREALGASGTQYESNPLMKWASRSTPRLIAVKLGVNALAAVAADRFAQDHPRLAWVMMGGLAALQTAIAVNNHRIATAHRR